jgi:hypothetical protein
MQIRSFSKPRREGPAARSRGSELLTAQGRATGRDGVLVRHRKKERSGKLRRVTVLRMFGIGLLAVVVLAGIVIFGLSRERVVSDAVWHDLSAGLYVPSDQAVMPLSEEKALELVRKVLNARSVQDLAGNVRLKDSSAIEAVDFLKRLEQENGKISRMNWIGNMDSNAIQIEAVEIFFTKELARPRRVLLTPDEHGVWQADLAALEGRSSMAWDEIIHEPAVAADVRVLVAHDNYYNGRYSDDHEWEAYALANPNSEVILIGYCRRSSEAHRILTTLLTEMRAARAIIRIQKTDLPESRQCEIESILAEDWILTDSPLDERRRNSSVTSSKAPEPVIHAP